MGFSCLWKERLSVPYKVKHGCHYPGCNKLTDGEYCEEHAKMMEKNYDARRSNDHTRKYGHEWKRIRERYVREHPLCEQCLKEGRFTPVEEVHHIVPLSHGGTNAWSNLMSVCKSCHNKLHIALGDRKPWK